MVKSITLTDLAPEKAILMNVVGRKISSSKFTSLNHDFDSFLKIDSGNLTLLLTAIDTKIHKAEVLFYSYFDSVDHAILSGISLTHRYSIELEFSYGTAVLKSEVSIDDKSLYKEVIDINFQHFILTIASLYENMVRLTEILVKKVILHQPGHRPLSTPLVNYKSFFDSLIRLGYRKQDSIYNCFNTHSSFLSKYLTIINSLRNSFIHGYATNLYSDGSNYKVSHQFDPTNFSAGSPDLNLDIFTKNILSNSILFYKDLLSALVSHIKHHSKSIPA